MSVHLFDSPIAGTPPEPLLLEAVAVRLIQDCERERFDAELVAKHYLQNANAVGRVLRYVAEYEGQWVALLLFSSPAFHIKLRDQWLHWPARRVKERRHLIAQNARFFLGTKIWHIKQVIPDPLTDLICQLGWKRVLTVRIGGKKT